MIRIIKSHKINSKRSGLFIHFLSLYSLRCWLCKYSLNHSSFTSTQKIQANCSTRSKKLSNTSTFCFFIYFFIAKQGSIGYYFIHYCKGWLICSHRCNIILRIILRIFFLGYTKFPFLLFNSDLLNLYFPRISFTVFCLQSQVPTCRTPSRKATPLPDMSIWIRSFQLTPSRKST